MAHWTASLDAIAPELLSAEEKRTVEALVALKVPEADRLPLFRGGDEAVTLRLKELLQQAAVAARLEVLLNYTIDPNVLKTVEGSLFALVEQMDVDTHSEYYGTGFFLGEPGKAVTADRCLRGSVQVGDTVDAYSPFYNCSFKLRVTQRDKDLDVAVLTRFEIPDGATDAPGNLFLKEHAGVVPNGRKVALCTCSIHLGSVLEETEPTFAVYAGIVNRYSHEKRLVLYDCSAFSGDCGGALVMHDGKVVGMHIEGINEVKERIARKQTVEESLTALEASVDSAVRGSARGAIAVVLDHFV